MTCDIGTVTVLKGHPDTLKLNAVLSSLDGRISFRLKDCGAVELNSNFSVSLQVCETFLRSVNAICTYAYTVALGPIAEDEIRWLIFEASVLRPAVYSFGASNRDQNRIDNLFRALDNVEKALNGTACRFIVTERTQGVVSVVDTVIWSTLHLLCQIEGFKGSGLTSKYPNTFKWYGDLLATDFKSIKTPSASNLKEFFKNYPVSQPKVAAPSKLDPTKSKNSSTAQEHKQVRPNVMNWFSVETTGRAARIHPILPKEGARNILITSALPYVNNIPHLGNIIGCVLSADVFSRYCRGVGHNSVYVSGTDEYGTATETKAVEEGVTPKEICDKYFEIHRDVYQWFNIGFDCFGRTTNEHQKKIAQDIFWKLDKAGHLLEDTVEQLRCDQCTRFLADRFVEGGCPFCGYDDARGDQCDACGKLIDATTLKNPKCKICKSPPRIVTSKHLFLNLPKLEPKLRETLDESMSVGFWSESARSITNAWLKDGLKPRCITRDLVWGTPVPKQGFTDKVFYVWFDAPIGYLSITASYCGDKWVDWWKNPGNVEIVNFMAKDNVPFHSVVFPISLIGANDNYGIVRSLHSTEYLNYEDGKFSKSRNLGVFGNNARDSGIPADVFRFYLLFIRPESQDSSFSWEDFATKNNSELLNNLGNFVNRALSFCANNFGGLVNDVSELKPEDCELIQKVNVELSGYLECMERAHLREGLIKVLNISRLGNGYIQSCQPWKLLKGDETMKKRGGEVNSISVNLVHLCAVLLEPYMPQTAATILDQMNLRGSQLPPIPPQFSQVIASGHKIGTVSPLFKKIEDKEVKKFREMYGSGNKAAGDGDLPKKPNDKSKKQPQPGQDSTDGGIMLVGLGSRYSTLSLEQLQESLNAQADKVRSLKATNAPKSVITAEVESLKALKAEIASRGGNPVPTAAPPVSKEQLPEKLNGPAKESVPVTPPRISNSDGQQPAPQSTKSPGNVTVTSPENQTSPGNVTSPQGRGSGSKNKKKNKKK